MQRAWVRGMGRGGEPAAKGAPPPPQRPPLWPSDTLVPVWDGNSTRRSNNSVGGRWSRAAQEDKSTERCGANVPVPKRFPNIHLQTTRSGGTERSTSLKHRPQPQNTTKPLHGPPKKGTAEFHGCTSCRTSTSCCSDKGVVLGKGGGRGECLPGARPAHARRATFVLCTLSLAPSLSSPREVPEVDRTRPQTFRAKHVV